MGNWLIYDIVFTASNMGLVEGISLLFAALLTIPFSKLINREKIPFVVFLAVLINAIGLFLTFLFVKSPDSVNGEVLLSAKNVPAFFCVFLVGAGYVLIMQACTIWVKCLFPEENRGQLEGVRVMFFTLIPMFVGTLMGNVIIKNTPQADARYDVYGHVIDVPQENLFLIAGFMVLVTFIPLYFAAKEYRKRVGQNDL
jgi:MFS family permease